MARVNYTYLDYLDDKYVDDFIQSIELILKASKVSLQVFCSDCGINYVTWRRVREHKNRLKITLVNAIIFILAEIAYDNRQEYKGTKLVDQAFDKINEILQTIDYRSFSRTRGL